MNALVGKALEEDEQFWNAGLFAAGEGQEVAEASDEDYDSKEESASAALDSFDSDFDRPDIDLERDSDDEDEDSDRPKKKKLLKKRKRANDESEDDEERKERQKKRVTFVEKRNRREVKAHTKKHELGEDLELNEEEKEDLLASTLAERRKSARLEKQTEKSQVLKDKGKKEPHKVLPGETSDLE